MPRERGVRRASSRRGAVVAAFATTRRRLDPRTHQGAVVAASVATPERPDCPCRHGKPPFPRKIPRLAYSRPEALFLGRFGLTPMYCHVYGPMRIRRIGRWISASIGRGLSPIHAGGDGPDVPKHGQIIPFGIIPADDGERDIPFHPKISRSVCRPPGRGDLAIARVPPYKGRDLEVSAKRRRRHSHANKAMPSAVGPAGTKRSAGPRGRKRSRGGTPAGDAPPPSFRPREDSLALASSGPYDGRKGRLRCNLYGGQLC